MITTVAQSEDTAGNGCHACNTQHSHVSDSSNTGCRHG
jgi:hypothetical protein